MRRPPQHLAGSATAKPTPRRKPTRGHGFCSVRVGALGLDDEGRSRGARARIGLLGIGRRLRPPEGWTLGRIPFLDLTHADQPHAAPKGAFVRESTHNEGDQHPPAPRAARSSRHGHGARRARAPAGACARCDSICAHDPRRGAHLQVGVGARERTFEPGARAAPLAGERPTRLLRVHRRGTRSTKPRAATAGFADARSPCGGHPLTARAIKGSSSGIRIGSRLTTAPRRCAAPTWTRTAPRVPPAPSRR